MKTLEEQIKEQEEKVFELHQETNIVFKKVQEYINLIKLKLEKTQKQLDDSVKLNTVNLTRCVNCENPLPSKMSTIFPFITEEQEQKLKEHISNVIKSVQDNSTVDFINGIFQTNKDKTLDDYMSEFLQTKNDDTKFWIANKDCDFEFSCGLLKYICHEMDKKYTEKGFEVYGIQRLNTGYYIYSGALKFSSFCTHSTLAMAEVIRICGTEFLDKIFKA